MPWAEPGAADVIFVPNWIEHPEPGGVNWTTRKPLSKAKSASSRHPRLAVEALRAIDVRHRNDDDLELQIDLAGEIGLGASSPHCASARCSSQPPRVCVEWHQDKLAIPWRARA